METSARSRGRPAARLLAIRSSIVSVGSPNARSAATSRSRLDRVGLTQTSMSFVARGGAWKLYVTPPMIRNSTLRWFNNAKKSAKSSFTVRPHLSPHPLSDLEALAAAEREPVIEVDLLGLLETLGDSQHALHT